MAEEKSRAEVRMLQAAQHVTIATVTTEQVQQYARSTTTKISKKFLDENETYEESDNNQFSPNINSAKSGDDGDYKIDEINVDDSEEFPNSSLLDRNDMKDGNQTPPHQITFISQPSASETHESILRGASENLTGLDEVKYFKEFISQFEELKEREKNNVYSCANDNVMDIRGDGDFAKFLTIEQYTKLLSVRPKRSAVLPNCWYEVVEEYYKEALTEGGPKKTISDWVSTTNALIVVNDKDTEEVTKIKKYLHKVMLPLIESFLKPIPDISAPNSSEHHYWAEFGHRFFSYALQEFAGLDWRAMEVPVVASKYRKNHGLDYSLNKVVEGKCADLLAWSWETGEEIFVGEQAGPPTKPDLTKLSMDSFKLYRELRDCLNVRILKAMEIGDVNYVNRTMFGILGYLFEIKMLIMWKDGVYVYEEFGKFTVASHLNNIHMMKSGILKLLEFVMVIKTELKNSTAKIENDYDKVQILKRKFSDFIQTKPSPIKVAKVRR